MNDCALSTIAHFYIGLKCHAKRNENHAREYPTNNREMVHPDRSDPSANDIYSYALSLLHLWPHGTAVSRLAAPMAKMHIELYPTTSSCLCGREDAFGG